MSVGDGFEPLATARGAHWSTRASFDLSGTPPSREGPRGRAQMVPVLGREVEEGEQSFTVLRQAGDCLVVAGAVLVGEHIDGRFGCRAGRRTVNFTKVCLHVDLDREGNFVEHVRGLVNPTPLVPGTRKDLLDCLPEAQRAVADR